MKSQQLHTLMQILLVLIVLLVPTILLAQPVGTPAGGADPDAPIDGGLSLLVAAGVGYGAKKLKEKRKRLILKEEKEG